MTGPREMPIRVFLHSSGVDDLFHKADREKKMEDAAPLFESAGDQAASLVRRSKTPASLGPKLKSHSMEISSEGMRRALESYANAISTYLGIPTNSNQEDTPKADINAAKRVADKGKELLSEFQFDTSKPFNKSILDRFLNMSMLADLRLSERDAHGNSA